MSKESERARGDYSDPGIAYRVLVAEPDAHRYRVTLDIARPDPAGQRLSLPNWIPGSYMIRDFSRHIVAIEAEGPDGTVPLVKLDKARWQAPAGLASLRVHCRIHARDASVREAWLDRERAFFNGTSLFLLVEGQRDRPVSVELVRPEHVEGASWRVATAMTAESVDAAGFGRYRAEDYDELIDHPVEMGDVISIGFEVEGVPHELVLTGRLRSDIERIAGDLERICRTQVRMFGAPPPFERYLFLVAVTDEGYGGLEHRASTALVIGRSELPLPDARNIDDRYLRFLGLCSHEYFHAWNVKRILPAAFVPLDLDREVHTRLLWFFEGVTSYYDDLVLVRAGLIDHERYLDLLAKTMTQIRRGAGRTLQSVGDSSFDAWHRFYKQDANAPNAIVSYYGKGALVALCVDAMLRRASHGVHTLDSLMRRLWESWLASPAPSYAGIDEDAPERMVAALIGEAAAARLGAMIDDTDELPLESALQTLGVGLSWCPRRASTDTGGRVSDADAAPVPWLGAVVVDEAGGMLVKGVANDGPAEQAGIAPGDRVVAIDRLAVAASGIDRFLSRYRVEDVVSVHWLRRGVLHEGSLAIRRAPDDTARLGITDGERVARWLGEAT